MEIRMDRYHIQAPGRVGRSTPERVRARPGERQDHATPGTRVRHQPTLPCHGRTEAAVQACL